MSDSGGRQDVELGALFATTDTLGIMAAITANDGGIVWLSQAWRDFASPEACESGVPWCALVPESHLEALQAWLAHPSPPSEAAHFECPLTQPSAAPRWHQLSLRRLGLAHGAYRLCHATDIEVLK